MYITMTQKVFFIPTVVHVHYNDPKGVLLEMFNFHVEKFCDLQKKITFITTRILLDIAQIPICSVEDS